SLVLLAAVRRRGRAAADSSGRAGPVQVVGRLYRLPGLAHEQAAARVLPASESGRHAGPAARQGRVAPDRPRRARAAAAGPGRRGGGALAAGPPAGAELVRGRPLHGVFPPEAGGTRGGLGGGRPGGPHGEFARRQVAPRDRRPERAGPPLTAPPWAGRAAPRADAARASPRELRRASFAARLALPRLAPTHFSCLVIRQFFDFSGGTI
ncbi:unnamed protein product, partial [Prorocentrum cordatum]